MTGKTKTQRGKRTMKELVSAPWLSPAEVARLLGVSTMTIRRLLGSHQLSAVRISNCLRISSEQLHSYMAGRILSPAPGAVSGREVTGPELEPAPSDAGR